MGSTASECRTTAPDEAGDTIVPTELKILGGRQSQSPRMSVVPARGGSRRRIWRADVYRPFLPRGHRLRVRPSALNLIDPTAPLVAGLHRGTGRVARRSDTRGIKARVEVSRSQPPRVAVLGRTISYIRVQVDPAAEPERIFGDKPLQHWVVVPRPVVVEARQAVVLPP